MTHIMKAFRKSALLAAVLILGSSCNVRPDLRAKILTEGEEALNKATKTVNETAQNLQKTKVQVGQKIEDIERAAKEVQEAVDAVKKVTGDGQDSTGPSTVPKSNPPPVTPQDGPNLR